MKQLIRHILKEETEEIDQKVMNFLMRRYEVEKKDIGWEDHPIIIKTINFNINNERFGISNFQNKITQVQQIFDMLIDSNVIEPIELYGKSLDPYRQKVIRTIKKFLSHVM
jgi:tRNA uridine 5-carbamoylmethylation protein Kti12